MTELRSRRYVDIVNMMMGFDSVLYRLNIISSETLDLDDMCDWAHARAMKLIDDGFIVIDYEQSYN